MRAGESGGVWRAAAEGEASGFEVGAPADGEQRRRALAGRLKVIDLAKELGVTSKDLLVALEGMGHKGKRAMTPLDTATANELRVKLGRGRDLPAEAKPKRPAKVRVDGA